jgi:hypothetical protein
MEPRSQPSSRNPAFPGAEPQSRSRKRTVSPLERNRAAQQLLRTWLADDSGYDEETWPVLKRALEEDRAPGQRRLFDGQGD